LLNDLFMSLKEFLNLAFLLLNYLVMEFFLGCYTCGGGLRVAAGYPTLRMETDKIRMESNSNNTFYHIFSRIQIWIRMFSNTNTKKMS
jgi:hypothetical protein